MSAVIYEPATQPRPQLNTTQVFDAVTPHTKSFQVSDGVSAMAISGSHMWVALSNGSIEVRDVHTGAPQHAFAPAHRPSATTRIWSMIAVDVDDGSDSGAAQHQVWIGLSSGTIVVYDSIRFTLIRQLRKHISGVYCLAHDAGVVYSGSSDFLMAQWRVADGQLLRVFKGHANYVRCIYAEGTAVVSGSDDRTIRIWHRDTGEETGIVQIHTQTGGVSALCRVGVTMWSGDDSGTLAVWQLRTRQAMLVSHNHKGRITTLKKIGSRVYAGSADGLIGVYDALDGTLVQTITGHDSSRVMAMQCAVEVDRFYVWSGAADNTVRCWHHDEHVPMTADRERFNDMRWYYATQQPFREANEQLLEEQRALSELVVLSQGNQEAVQALLENTQEEKQSAAARYFLLEKRLREAHDRTTELDRERGLLSADLGIKQRALQVMRENLERMLQSRASMLQAAPQPAALAPQVAPVAAAAVSSPGVPGQQTYVVPPPQGVGAAPPVHTATTPPAAAVPLPSPSTAVVPPAATVPAPPGAVPLPSQQPVLAAAAPSVAPPIPTPTAAPTVNIARSNSYEPPLPQLPPPPLASSPPVLPPPPPAAAVPAAPTPASPQRAKSPPAAPSAFKVPSFAPTSADRRFSF